jgi:hypothetical protein
MQYMISCKLNTQRGKCNSFCARFNVSEVLMLYCVAGNLIYLNILKNHSAFFFQGLVGPRRPTKDLPTLEDEGATSLQ